MTNKRRLRNLCTQLLAMILVFSMLLPVSAAAAPVTGGNGNISDQIYSENVAAFGETEAVNDEEAAPDPEESTRILVKLRAEGALGAGYPAEDIVENEEAMAYTAELTEKQNAMAEAIDNDLYGGSGEFTVWSNLTLVVNAFEAIVKYGDIEKIGAYLSEKYPDDFEEIYTYSKSDATGTAAAETVSADPVSASATLMVGAAGANGAWESGYTGAGQLIAIIDTGLETTHPSFDAEALQYSLDELTTKTGETYKLYVAQDFASVLPDLEASGRYSRSHSSQALQVSDVYKSKKIPFAFNYVSKNTEIENADSAGAEHGMHVAGIAAANKYVKNTGSDQDVRPYVPQEKGVVGVAPDAQLVIMKVSDASAYESEYFPAIEDAIKLGCDAVNVSLATNEPGRSWFFDKSIYGSQFAKVFDEMVNFGTVVACGAGNMGYWPYYTRADQDYGLNYSEDIPMATGGYPGSFTNTLSVAAAYNTVVTGSGSTFNDCFTVIRDNDQEKIQKWETLNTAEDPSEGVDIPYVFLGDPNDKSDMKKYGGPEAYDGIDVKGKIVVVSRGGTPEEGFDGKSMSFPYKHEQAEEHGAKACLIYNNESADMGIIALENSSATIPCASITLDDKKQILEKTEKNAQTQLYEGEMHIDNLIKTSPGPKGYQITEFSSWGTTGNLAIKPEITAPGGNIYSTVPTKLGSYATMSGTSMATPSITGQSALIAQRLKEEGIVQENGTVRDDCGFATQRALVTSLMMSTATPLTDPENDKLPYPVRQQGAGLANVGAATRSNAYIIMGEDATDSWADGKVKAELGDDADRNGEYTFSFKIKNISESALTYTFHPIVMTPLVIEDEDKGHKYMTYVDTKLSSDVTFEINGKGDCETVTVPARGDTEVKVTITLSEEDKALFEENNPKGAYVEGYIQMKGEVDLSVPFLAFYGNFSEPSMFDRATINTYDAETNPSYVTADKEDPLNYLNAIEINGDGDIVGDIKLGKNFFAEEDAFIPERNMTVPLNTQILRVFPSFIRVPAIVRTVVSARKTESETFEECWSRNTWGRPAYFNFSTGDGENPYDTIRIQATMYDSVIDQYERPVEDTMGPSYWNGKWDGNDQSGSPVTGTDGAQLEIKVVAPPELYTTIGEDGIPKFDENDLAEGAIWRTVITVDGTDPEIIDGELRYMWDKDGGARLLVPVQDNRYTAAVLVFNTGVDVYGQLLRMPLSSESEDEALQRIAVNQEELGAKTAVDVPLENVESESLLIVAVDYAGNYVSQEVTLPDLKIAIDYEDETLTGFESGHEYTINGKSVEPTADGTLDIPAEWLGTELAIVDTTDDSAIPQLLPVPARPQAPGGLSAGTTSADDSTDGSIGGLDKEKKYEYRTEDGTWTAAEPGADFITGLGVGKYYVRLAATDDAFASLETEVEVKVYVAPPPGGFLGPSHNVTVAEPTGGTVDSSLKSAWEGSTVTVTPKPSKGYITGGVTVKDADGGAVAVTEQKNGTYTFTMPKGSVTVEAQFLTPAQYYTDSPADWYAEALAYVTNEGLMNGVSASPRRFGPDATLTRGMMVTILWQLDGEKTVAASSFTDVKADQWFAESIAWAAANGIVDGYGNGTFGPDDLVTREQMAAILYRYASYKGYGVSNLADLSGYTDADSVSGWASTAMRWIVAEGIIAGTSTTTLAPVGESTRAQVATVLMRFCEGVAK